MRQLKVLGKPRMRIAVSGTHCTGKTTLIDEFLRTHTDYTHEPEPYTVLVEDFGEEFSAEPCADDFYRQLEFNAKRLSSYSSNERVIFERCPVDFLAYILALSDLKIEDVDATLIKTALRMTLDALKNLDLIVYLPLDETGDVDVADSEFPKLRAVVDSRLVAIFDDDDFGLFNSDRITVVDARGSTAQRLIEVEQAMELRTTNGDDGLR